MLVGRCPINGGLVLDRIEHQRCSNSLRGNSVQAQWRPLTGSRADDTILSAVRNALRKRLRSATLAQASRLAGGTHVTVRDGEANVQTIRNVMIPMRDGVRL